MRFLVTKKEGFFPKKLGLTTTEQAAMMRLNGVLMEPEISDLNTGKHLVKARTLLEPYGGFLDYLIGLPFTYRTAYRRIKTYERALEIWPKELVEAAIERKLRIFGWSQEKPMGVFEDVEVPPKNLTPEKAREYLNRAELLVRRAPPASAFNAYSALKECFRFVERRTRNLPPEDRAGFLDDLVGLEMTLLEANPVREFRATEVPTEFWAGASSVSPKTRTSLSKAATDRWERIRKAKAAILRKRS
jgi:hypothetical protein